MNATINTNNTKEEKLNYIARELARRYSTMTHDELDTLKGILVPMKFNKGEMVLREGEICRYIYYLDRGLIRQFYFKNDKEVTENLGSDKSIFMCIESLFKEKPSHLQVEALETSYVYALPKRRLEEEAIKNINIQMLYRKILEESLIISQVHADLVRFESATNRYRRLCQISPQVIERAPLVYIANYLQMTPETLSRVRKETLLEDSKNM